MSCMGGFLYIENKIQKIKVQVLYYKYIVYTLRCAYTVKQK